MMARKYRRARAIPDAAPSKGTPAGHGLPSKEEPDMLDHADVSRADHIAWCQRRALDFVDIGDLAQALASLQSDLRKHPNTAGHPAIVSGMVLVQAGKLRSPGAMRAFILSIDRPETLADAWAKHCTGFPASLQHHQALEALRSAFYLGARNMLDIGFRWSSSGPLPEDLARIAALEAELDRFLRTLQNAMPGTDPA